MRTVVRVPEYVHPMELVRAHGLDKADCIFVSSVDPRDEISAQKLPDQLQGLLLKEEQLVGDWPEEIKEHLRRWGRLEAWKRNPNSYEELAKLARRSPLNPFEKVVQSTLERALITIGQDSELWKAWEQYIDPETQKVLAKAAPKKVIRECNDISDQCCCCPVCYETEDPSVLEELEGKPNYCRWCGQKLDWTTY